AAASISLEVAFAHAIREIAPALDDGHVSAQEVIADAGHEPEREVEIVVRQIVEKNSTDAARLLTMFEIEILVAPLLEAWMIVWPEWNQGFLAGAVKVDRILFEAIIRREVHSTPEPPYRLGARLFGHEEAHVHMHRGDIWIPRVEDERHPHRLETASGEFGAR